MLLHCLFPPPPQGLNFRVVQVGAMGQLFDGAGKVPRGFTIILGPSSPLIARLYGQMLISKSVLSCSDIV
jgi:hypothetical protein